MKIFPQRNEFVNNSFYNPIYSIFGKPFTFTSVKPIPIIVKCILPLIWESGVYDDRSIGNGIVITGHGDSGRTYRSSLSTEESYIVRPDEAEMQVRMVEILSGGVYSFLKKEGLLKETRRGESRRYGLEETELEKLDTLIRRLTEGKDLS